MKSGITLPQLAAEIKRQQTTKRDILAPTGKLFHSTDDNGITRVEVEGPDQQLHQFPTTELFRRQVADRLGVPWQYFDRLRKDHPALLDENVNQLFRREPSNRMVRTLDGHARAFLSDKYRRLDYGPVLEAIYPFLASIPGLQFESVALTDTKMYLKVVTPQYRFEMQPGDLVQAGVVISNSEVGQGSLTVQRLIYRCVCSNGLIVPDAGFRKTHLGRVNGVFDDGLTVYSDETLEAEDKAFFLKARDTIISSLSEATFVMAAKKMQRTISMRLTGNPTKAVEQIATRFLLTEQESNGVLASLMGDQMFSAYGLVNAVTDVSKSAEAYDRATVLEEVGGRMVDLKDSDWLSILTAM
jgi:Domain of unknown function (DUF932)